jgi:DNA-binding IclR family transcriptional regulator
MMNTEEKNVTSTIKSVDRALEVIEAFSEIRGGIKLSCLSEKLNMNKSGVYRLLQVFKQRGYVEQKRKNGEYHLGLAAYMVGQNIVSNMELVRMARPIMERLVREHNETIYLALPSEKKVLLFDCVDSSQVVNVMSLKGLHCPLSECAAGEVLQAFGMASVEGAFDTPPPHYDRLAVVKQQGYSTDAHLLGDGVVSLAVPLLNAEAMAVGSICFVGPEFRLTDEKIKSSLLRSLVDAGHAISAKLGYYGYHLT